LATSLAVTNCHPHQNNMPEAVGMTDGPATETMTDLSVMKSADALLIKQTTRGCLQECLGCEAKSEFTVAPLDWSKVDSYKVAPEAMEMKDTMYALEQSSCLMRFCCRDGRSFNMGLSHFGGMDEKNKPTAGKPIVNYVKPLGCPLNLSIPTNDGSIDCPCCCFLPKIDMTTPDGAPMNSQSSYVCTPCLAVPKLRYAEDGQDVYMLRPETCCGGCCIACSCSNLKGCAFIPFYFHDPVTMEPIGGFDEQNAPQIRKVWAGWQKECCTSADTFAVKFPQGIDDRRKAGIVGLTFLLDFTVFERQQGEG